MLWVARMYISLFRIILISCISLFLILPFLIRESKIIPNQGAITDLAIGNSHARAINFDAMGLLGYNGYEPGADVRDTIASFYRLKKHLPSLRRIWIPVAPVFIFRDKPTSEFLRETKIFKENIFDFWRLGHNWLSDIKKDLYPPPASSNVVVEGAITSTSILDINQLEDLAFKTAVAHAQHASLGNALKNLNIIEELINEAVKCDIKVILFTPPYTMEYYESNLLEEYRLLYNDLMLGVSDRQEGVYFFDLHDQFKVDQYNFFLDDDHLNLMGSKIFSPILLKTVSEIISIENSL